MQHILPLRPCLDLWSRQNNIIVRAVYTSLARLIAPRARLARDINYAHTYLNSQKQLCIHFQQHTPAVKDDVYVVVASRWLVNAPSKALRTCSGNPSFSNQISTSSSVLASKGPSDEERAGAPSAIGIDFSKMRGNSEHCPFKFCVTCGSLRTIRDRRIALSQK